MTASRLWITFIFSAGAILLSSLTIYRSLQECTLERIERYCTMAYWTGVALLCAGVVSLFVCILSVAVTLYVNRQINQRKTDRALAIREVLSTPLFGKLYVRNSRDV